MPSCLAGHGRHRREGLAFSAVEWIGSRNAASSTCRGPPLDRKSRPMPRSRAGAHGEPMRASTTVCCANARARKDDRLGGAASGAGQRTVRRMTRPRGTSGGEAPASHVQLYVGNNAGHGLGGPCRARLSGQAIGRRVTTATPFAPRWSRPGGLGKLQLTPAANERQRLFAAYPCNAREMAVVSGGACNRNDGGKYLSNAHVTETTSGLDSH